jgi:hypothetical protein
MTDAENYAKPTEFDGFRFVANTDDINRAANSKSRFCQPSSVFPFWGAVGRAWYVCIPQFSQQDTF